MLIQIGNLFFTEYCTEVSLSDRARVSRTVTTSVRYELQICAISKDLYTDMLSAYQSRDSITLNIAETFVNVKVTALSYNTRDNTASAVLILDVNK